MRILTSLGLSKYNPKRVTIKDDPIRLEEEEWYIMDDDGGGEEDGDEGGRDERVRERQ